jgi:hypothetical protein
MANYSRRDYEARRRRRRRQPKRFTRRMRIALMVVFLFSILAERTETSIKKRHYPSSPIQIRCLIISAVQ